MPEYSSISPQSSAPAPAAAKDEMPAREQLLNEPSIHTPQKISIQCKLAIGAADDPLEHEADAMAGTIMRMPEQNFIQRKCAHCEEEEKVQRKPVSDSVTPFVQTKSNHTPVVSDTLQHSIESSKGKGSGMEGSTHSFLASRFGNDFSDVKIHTDGEAVDMNRELNANAFTVGTDIYFNQGQYQPHSDSGKHLLAHELTHVLQQGSGKINRQLIQRENTSLGAGELGIVNVLSTPRLQIIPPDLERTRVGPEGRIMPGLPGDRASRLNVVVGAGMTFTELAQILLPLWNSAIPFTPEGTTTPLSFPPLTVDELAQGLLMYNFNYLGGTGFSQWQEGVRIMLPVYVETTTHTGISHPLLIRDLASGFDIANMALLTQPAGAATNPSAQTPDPMDIHQRQQAATDFLAQYPDTESRGAQLLSRSLVNARETRELVRRVLGDQTNSRAAFDIALAFMNAAVISYISILRAQADGLQILGLVEMFLTGETFPDLDAATQANLDRATRMLTGISNTRGVDVPGAAPACDGGNRQVTVDFVALHGNTRNVLQDLQVANQVYQPCCVQLVVNSLHTVDEATTHQWLNNDTDLRSNRSCASPALEERQMRQGAQTLFNLNGQIKAFYVESFSGQGGNVIGYAFTRECGSVSFANHLVIRNNANDLTLAHEAGHLLLNARHWLALDNLMNPVATDRRLTARQCRTIFNRSIHPKLKNGSSNDPLEKEADDVANKVMRMPEQNFVQRKCAPCKKEENKVQRKSLSESITPFVQAKEEVGATVSEPLDHMINSSQGSGQRMDSQTQSFMSSRFGAGFNHVKIHTGGEAVQMNRELNARAFAVGNDIYFNEGEYQPHSDSGKQLLAHELTHTLQQTGTIQRDTGSTTTAAPTEEDRREFAEMQDRFFSAQGAIMEGQILHSAGFAEGASPTTPADAERLINFWGLSMATIVSQMSRIAASLGTQVRGRTTSVDLAQQQADDVAALSTTGQQAYRQAVQLVRDEPFWNSYMSNNDVYIFPDLQGSNRFSGYNQAARDPDDPTGQRKVIIVHISTVHLENNFPEISASTIIHELSHVIYEPAVLDRALASFRNSIAELLLDHPDIAATRAGAADESAAREEQRSRISQILYETLAYGEEEIFVHLQQLTQQPDVTLRHADGSEESLRGAQLIEREILTYVQRLQRIGLERHMLAGVLGQIAGRVALLYDRRIEALPAGSRDRQIMEANKRMAQLLFDMAVRGQEL